MDRTSLSLLDRLRQQPLHDDWTRLVALYRPFIERFIRLDARLADDADDICQEVLKKVVEHLPRFERRTDGSFRAWLRTITANEVNQYWRRCLRGGKAEGGETGFPLSELQDPRNELSRKWDREHTDFVLRRLLELIEPDFLPATWQAFRLRVFDELSTAQVADRLGMSRNAVDIAKSRVLARLRHEAAGFVDE